MANKIWCFGDSHTAGHGSTPGFEYYEKYKGGGIWSDLLVQWTGLECINKGGNGFSNDMILDRLIQSFDGIESGDWVIIGKTYSHRFDVPIKNSREWRLQPIFNMFDKFVSEDVKRAFTDEELKTIVDFMYYFGNNEVWKKRQALRFDFIKGLLEKKGVNCFIWDVVEDLMPLRCETIIIATNNSIKDSHMSFYGHKQFGKWIAKRVFDLDVEIGVSSIPKTIL